MIETSRKYKAKALAFCPKGMTVNDWSSRPVIGLCGSAVEDGFSMDSGGCAGEFRKVEYVFTHVTFVVPFFGAVRGMDHQHVLIQPSEITGD